MDALMSRLEQGDGTAFEQLCKALTSPDNDARRQAEDFYKTLFDKKADLGVRYLCGGLSDDKPDMKHFCCVYLRKVRRRIQSPVNINNKLIVCDLLLPHALFLKLAPLCSNQLMSPVHVSYWLRNLSAAQLPS